MEQVNLLERSKAIGNKVRFERYMRKKFDSWRQKVKGYLPQLTIDFYTAKMNGLYIDSEKERLLGTVISNINNISYAWLDYNGKRMDSDNILASEVILLIQVNELFSFIKTHCKIITHE